MSRVPFYLRERVDEIKRRALFETYETQKLPKWEQIALTWVALFSFWIVISGNARIENLFIGGITTLVISLFMYEMLTDDIRRSGHIIEKILYIGLFAIPQYLFIMAFRLIESNFKVAKHALLMDINPGIVKIKTDLHSDTGITILANSITLTPGTLTIDITKKLGETYLYVHWISVETLNREMAGEKIKGDIEGWLKKIFW